MQTENFLLQCTGMFNLFYIFQNCFPKCPPLSTKLHVRFGKNKMSAQSTGRLFTIKSHLYTHMAEKSQLTHKIITIITRKTTKLKTTDHKHNVCWCCRLKHLQHRCRFRPTLKSQTVDQMDNDRLGREIVALNNLICAEHQPEFKP